MTHHPNLPNPAAIERPMNRNLQGAASVRSKTLEASAGLQHLTPPSQAARFQSSAKSAKPRGACELPKIPEALSGVRMRLKML